MIESEYLVMRHEALILRDEGGYNLSAAEMNPVIFEEFIGLLLEEETIPVVIWEPFATQAERNRFCDFAEEVEIELISQSLNPKDRRVRDADSTISGPYKDVGGILFHPPYFGAVPGGDKDVCLNDSEDSYIECLRQVVRNSRLVPGGLVCAVGRTYRFSGKKICLDKWYLSMFESEGFHLTAVWQSEPDVVLIFKKGKR